MNRKRGRDRLQSGLVANDLSVEREGPSLSLQLIPAGERSRAPGMRGPGQPRRRTHPTGSRKGGGEKTFAPTAPGTQGGGWPLSQTPGVYSLRNWPARKPFAKAPALCASREGSRGRFRAPPFLPPRRSPGSRADSPARFSWSPGHPLTLTPVRPAPPLPRGRTDWLGL